MARNKTKKEVAPTVTPAVTPKVTETESTEILTIAEAEKAGYVSLAESEKAQKSGKSVIDIITVENRKMHKLQ